MADPVTIESPTAPIKYIAELFKQVSWTPTLSNAPNNISRDANVYHFSLAPLITDPTNYWIVWGGTFDNPIDFGIQVYMGQFLTRATTVEALQAVENSFFVDEINYICYINISKKPWQYVPAYAALYANPGSTFASAPKNENNLSDIYYGPIRAEPKLIPPTLKNALADEISGINVYNTFNIVIDNSDGAYDGLDILSYYNTPLVVSKASFEVQSINDFNRIRSGLVSDIQVDFNKMMVEAVDQLYALDTSFCRKFTVAEFPDIDAKIVNTDIPVGWGVLRNVPLIEIDRDTGSPVTWIDYIAIDPNYITAASAIYDQDGNSLTFTFNAGTGVIRATQLDGGGTVIEAESADITGSTSNKIGQIIIDALSGNENLPYVSGIWDITETNSYLTLCASANIYFESGSTRDLVKLALRNDIAFLIQKNNGLLTIRQWGQSYNTHHIPEWMITQRPTKNFRSAYKTFMSTAEVKYMQNFKDDTWERTVVDESMELSIFEKYRRSFKPTFYTNLSNGTEAANLATRLLERFGEFRETIQIGVGVDTFGVDLLDRVDVEASINGREFSEYSRWIVKEADPGQDVLVLEGTLISWVLTFDGADATLDDYLFAVAGRGIVE